MLLLDVTNADGIFLNRPFLNNERKSRFHEKKTLEKTKNKITLMLMQSSFFCQEVRMYVCINQYSKDRASPFCIQNVAETYGLDFLNFFIFYFYFFFAEKNVSGSPASRLFCSR